MGGVVFLTGATGFVGTQTARRLITQTDCRIIALVQAPDPEVAARRLRRAFWDWPELREDAGGRVEAMAGDIRRPQLGLAGSDYQRLVTSVTHIIHAAADIHVLASLEQLRQANVGGVANVLELAGAVHADHGLTRLAHISTAYVAGRRTGVIAEAPPSGEGGFSNAYEQTKYEGECLVQQAREALPVSVFRPAMIVGDSKTGAITTFNTFYVPIRRYLVDGRRLMVAGSGLRINIIPVDEVADSIVRLTFDPAAVGLTFHLTAPHDSLPTPEAMAEAVRQWAISRGLPPRRMVRVPAGPGAALVRARDRRLAVLLPYVTEQRVFRRDNVDRLLGPYRLDWREYLPHLLDYAADRAFMHGSGRTVHEQILYRLGSHAGAVRLHDIVDGRSTARDATVMRRDIMTAAGALGAMGVTKGSRVAIVGLNSTRYLILEAAIGLCGAVSVPLYYTSPPAELDAILRSSHARLLLVGSPVILDRLGELSTSVPVVSFCRGPVPGSLPKPVLSWDQLMARGIGRPGSEEAPVDLDDVATLRYTSGTTGPPKGVVFTHAQLRWMAQTMVSLLPWDTRKGENWYLSFLPLNHVVEGILCSYAAYNLPGAMNVYFLENFHALPSALRQVRPTIFFSVPRVYEKAWAQQEASGLSIMLRRLPAAVQRAPLRWLLLRGMGLDRCEYRIVGSAPPADSLLRAYREIGIEIHNAYGLTEAPLVAINRVGRNRIGTVGELLPGTAARVAADGEILVRGPQVTSGYDDPAVASPLDAGWLHTGDAGHLSQDGYLSIDGRRKDLIVTSYAKKVSPEKVETLLRTIPGVAEALLIGDGRPYCTALLWVEDGALESGAMRSIDRAVVEVGRQLAPPERPRRWAILRNELSVERGDLTATLKPKRAAVLRRYGAVIDGLYAEPERDAGAMHVADIDAPVPVGA